MYVCVCVCVTKFCVRSTLKINKGIKWLASVKMNLQVFPDAIQKRANKLIEDPALTDAFESLAHLLSPPFPLFSYRYYRGVCCDEIKSIIPPKVSFAQNTRISNIQHPFSIKLDTNRTNTFTDLCHYDF